MNGNIRMHADIKFQWKEYTWEQEKILWEEGQFYTYGKLPSDGDPVYIQKGWVTLIYFVNSGEVEGVERCYCEPGNFLLMKNTTCKVIPSNNGLV